MQSADTPGETTQSWATVVDRAYTTPDFREALIANPERALSDAGVNIPSGTKLVFHELEPHELHVFLPRTDGNRATTPQFHVHYTTVGAEFEDQMTGVRTTIRDISALGPLLDEGRLVTAIVAESKDGGTDGTGGPCGACH